MSTMSTTPPAFATCDFCDLHQGDATGAFRVLPPVFTAFGGRRSFFGAVVTLRCFEDNALVRATLETPGEGRVLVIDGGGSRRRALVGGKLGALAASNGWAGLVVDGCVRDVRELAPLPIGILALASMPMPPEKRTTGIRDLPIQVQGVAIRPGDWLYADDDGVVVSARPL